MKMIIAGSVRYYDNTVDGDGELRIHLVDAEYFGDAMVECERFIEQQDLGTDDIQQITIIKAFADWQVL